MAKEVVITSVPRGIKLGREGFQPVMRTAGISDGVLTSLEQLAGYRHVPAQGSGRNPVIYGYRSVRGNTGQLNVLGRTVDAGNDFSNRSNKLAHFLVVEPIELPALRNSSPAAVLATIESRLATAWQGGPEERPTPFVLPAPPVQPAACRRWQTVKGDAGWGGLLAQRAARGQASLLISPDCSPTWSRTLLELFAEVLALLPPDLRWRTTFETTVIGTSASLLRGTYAGSPESAAGHAGLLLVDLSQRGSLPANVAVDEFVTIAREGPKQPAGHRPPRIPGGPPVLEGGVTDAQPVASGAGPAIGRSGPPRAPGRWEEDDEPKSRLGWYIFGGILLFGLLMAGAGVGLWRWLDDQHTRQLQKRIFDYAAIEDQREPQGEVGPKLEDWKRAFREDEGNQPDTTVFPLLLSALRTKAITADKVSDPAARADLLAACRGVQSRNSLLENAGKLGCDLPSDRPDPDKRRALLQDLTKEWLDQTYAKQPISSVATLQTLIDNATPIVAAACTDQNNKDLRERVSADNIRAIWPEAFQGLSPNDVNTTVATFRSRVAWPHSSKNETALTCFTKTLGEAKPRKEEVAAAPPRPEPNPKESAKNAARALFAKLTEFKQRALAGGESEIELASGLEIAGLDLKSIRVSLPKCGDWMPQAKLAAIGNSDDCCIWELTGRPYSPDSHWGTVTIDRRKGILTFKPEGSGEACDHLFVPLQFSCKDLPVESAANPIIIAAAEGAQVAVSPNASTLFDVLAGGTVQLTTSPAIRTSSILFAKPNVLECRLDTGHTNSGIRLETRAAPAADGCLIDVWLVGPGKKPVWLESLRCRCIVADGSLGFSISFLDGHSKPWAERNTRLLTSPTPLPPTDKPWSREKFCTLVKLILDDEPPPSDLKASEPKANTIDAIEERYDDWLRLKPGDKRDSLTAWRADVLAALGKPLMPYRSFVEADVAQTDGKRPTDLPEPQEPDRKATPEQVKQYEAAMKKFRDDMKSVSREQEKWDELVRERLQSVLMLRRFLEDSSTKPEDRELALVVLGIDAWAALRNEREAIAAAAKDLTLDRFLTASLSLSWHFDGKKPIAVPRFNITSSKSDPAPSSAQGSDP